MIKYSEFLSEKIVTEDMQDKINILMYLSENEMINESLDTMNEAEVLEGVNNWLGKIGMKLHKGDGIIDYIKQFSTGAGKLIMAAIKGDKEKVKEIADSLEKAKVIDFLLKLDMVTLHLLSAPIHFIHGITGWDLEANLKHMVKGAESIIDMVKKAFGTIRDNIKNLAGNDKQGRVALNNLENVFIPIKKG